MNDPYEILGIDKSANDAQITHAFREIAKQCHPDLFPGDIEKEERFKAASEAYEEINSQVKRAQYFARRVSTTVQSHYRAPERKQPPPVTFEEAQRQVLQYISGAEAARKKRVRHGAVFAILTVLGEPLMMLGVLLNQSSSVYALLAFVGAYMMMILPFFAVRNFRRAYQINKTLRGFKEANAVFLKGIHFGD